MKKLSKMTMQEQLAYWHHKERYGEVPKTDEELFLAVRADITFTQLFAATLGKVVWDRSEERFVCF